MNQFDFYPGERVYVKMSEDLKGYGTIEGCATVGIIGIGRVYIVEVSPEHFGLDVKTYPFKCISVPQTMIMKLDGPFYVENGKPVL